MTKILSMPYYPIYIPIKINVRSTRYFHNCLFWNDYSNGFLSRILVPECPKWAVFTVCYTRAHTELTFEKN